MMNKFASCMLKRGAPASPLSMCYG
jgi:electron transfer flavoprotein alpha subunit